MQRVSLSLFAIVLLAAEMVGPALGQPTPNSEIAPTGKLRAAVIGIRVLGGVGEPIGKFIAGNLGVPFESVVYPNPDAYEQSFGKGQWDIAIGPRVLAPADNADVTPDVWLIELLYLAAVGHEFASADQVDRPGVKVGAIQNSPSDRFLTRTLKSAQLVRLPLSPSFPSDAIELLRSGKADAFGADSGLIDSIASGYPGAKIVPGAFNTVRVAIALPKGRSAAAQAKLVEIVSEATFSEIMTLNQAGARLVSQSPRLMPLRNWLPGVRASNHEYAHIIGSPGTSTAQG
jgi:polar amino acid transport system substrate-binding protein